MNYTCPKCGAELMRCRRNFIDRIISLLFYSERYRCDKYGYDCDFTALKRVNPN